MISIDVSRVLYLYFCGFSVVVFSFVDIMKNCCRIFYFSKFALLYHFLYYFLLMFKIFNTFANGMVVFLISVCDGHTDLLIIYI